MISEQSADVLQDPRLLAQIVSAEIDLEIGLRERLAQTLEARIAWANLLKQTLQNDTQTPTAAPQSFKYAATEALKAAENPAEILLEREEPAPPNLRLQEALRNARPAPKSKLPVPQNPKTAFLYIRLSTFLNDRRDIETMSDLYILKCPACSRTTFTSLQGLLNHARISHSLEWGTHEDCIRACAVPDPNVDVEAGIEVGGGYGGILPGLRTIFQMAVGSSYSAHLPPVGHASANVLTSANDAIEQEPTSHLTKTLGLHEDTPALAPFLGKEPIRRGIKVHEQDEFIHIDGFDNPHVPKSRWRLRFAQRSAAEQEGIDSDDHSREKEHSEDINTIQTNTQAKPDEATLSTVPSLVASASRFHFTSRIVITDRSLSVNIAKDSENVQFTHKWMLTIEAPSYAHHITTILDSMTVIPMSSVEYVLCHQATTSHPPFVVVGMASQPFLAKIKLVFNPVEDKGLLNGGQGQPYYLEHWVDLDPLKCSAVVIGEEQIVDVELDKKTIIRPMTSESTSINLREYWKMVGGSSSSESRERNQQKVFFAYEQVLKDLLPQFPLTAQESRRRRGSQPILYKLVASELQFRNLIHGRRKAIEWGRARALSHAYNDIIRDKNEEGLFSLSPADVYAWLREEGYYLRDEDSGKSSPQKNNVLKKSPNESNQSHWCTVCGLGPNLHLLAKTVKEEQVNSNARMDSPQLSDFMNEGCQIAFNEEHISRLPPINIGRSERSSIHRNPAWRTQEDSHSLACKEIVTAVDPRLLLATRSLILRLQLRAFEVATSSDAPPLYPLDRLGRAPDEVESTLAPYGLLALCLRPFIRRILMVGVEVAKHQKSRANALSSQKIAKKKQANREGESDTVSVLTPAHIFSGIRNRGRTNSLELDQTRLDRAILLCLSDLGTAFTPQQQLQTYVGDQMTSSAAIKHC